MQQSYKNVDFFVYTNSANHYYKAQKNALHNTPKHNA